MGKYVGVIGSGSFGMTVAKLLSENVEVCVLTRRKEIVDAINRDHFHMGIPLNPTIKATMDAAYFAENCHLIFPVIPSSSFRSVMKELSHVLKPSHILIHGTKGLDTGGQEKDILQASFSKQDIKTMSEVILDETSVVRVGCLSGPNLAKEILQGLPAASVIASEYEEVILAGQKALSSKIFTVFGSNDIRGAELAGAFKNIIALGSGILAGLGLGKNMEALLLTRGLREMIEFGMAFGMSGQAFLGTAGIGDLIATCTSDKSRNFTFGYRFAKGETLDQILASSDEVVEGVRTLKIIYQLAKNDRIVVPITQMLYKSIYEGYPIPMAIDRLMNATFTSDIDFVIQR